MSIVPFSVFAKHVSPEAVASKVDELFGEKFTVTLNVTRDSSAHKVELTVTNKDGEEIHPLLKGDDGVSDQDLIRTAAFAAEVGGLLIENGHSLNKKTLSVLQLMFLAVCPEEIKEAIKKEHSNED